MVFALHFLIRILLVIAFDAHVLKWNLDDEPPDEFTRHHIKEASFYGVHTWTIDLTIKLPENDPDAGLLVNFIGIEERGMWPAKQKSRNADGGFTGPTMPLFEKLDAWLEQRTKGAVDRLLMGGVGGAEVI
jgi:hypothetical protein